MAQITLTGGLQLLQVEQLLQARHHHQGYLISTDDSFNITTWGGTNPNIGTEILHLLGANSGT